MKNKNSSRQLVLVLLVLAIGIIGVYFLINVFDRDTSEVIEPTPAPSENLLIATPEFDMGDPFSDQSLPTESFLAMGDFGYEIQTSSDVESVFSYFTHRAGLANWFNSEAAAARSRFENQSEQIVEMVAVQQVLPVNDNTYQVVLSYDLTTKGDTFEEVSPGVKMKNWIYLTSTNVVRCDSLEICVTVSQTNEEEEITERVF